MNQSLLNEFNCSTDSSVTHERLCKLIEFHISVKKWVKIEVFSSFGYLANSSVSYQFESWFLHTTEVYAPFVLVLLICGIIYMACSILHLDLVSENCRTFDAHSFVRIESCGSILLQGTTIGMFRLKFHMLPQTAKRMTRGKLIWIHNFSNSNMELVTALFRSF